MDVAAFGPSEFSEATLQRLNAALPFPVPLGQVDEYADPPHALSLLCPRRKRPCRRRAAEQRDELAAPDHSITSSAATSRPGGTVRPSAFAVLRLMIVSNLVAACTGRSAGLSPRRVRS